MPREALLLPVLEPGHVRAGLDEELHLHLLELARPEDEVPRRDLVAERLSDLGDAERNLLSRGLLDVDEVDVDALRGLGPQIHDGCRVLDRAHERLEHQIELARGTERAFHAAGRALGLGCARRAFDLRIVGTKAFLAIAAVDERVNEAGDVARRLPDARVHEDRGVESFDVVAGAHHGVPPPVLDVLLELDAQRAIVPYGSGAAVDLGGLVHEPAPLAQGHEAVHHVGMRCVRHVGRYGSERAHGAAVRRRAIRSPWKRPFSMKVLLASLPDAITPAMNTPGTAVSIVAGSCAGIPVTGSIGTSSCTRSCALG